ncbi:hypothetical protein PybrP1_012264 [[Pythium] brassicae (nom. inval.)]|nr:hypothetical protein PybrP1_012264 [[Pythium] brassicae (nom. inval.)]
MGNRGSAAAAATTDKQQELVETMEQSLMATRQRKSMPRDGSLDFVPVPRLFTAFKSFSAEWNLCGKFDPTRRVNVVSDAKLQRKQRKHLFVDKIARLRMNSEAVALARNELEIMAFLSNFCFLHLGYIHRNVVHLYGYFTFRHKAHVVVEFCELGSLTTALVRAPDLGLRLNVAPTEDEAMYLEQSACCKLSDHMVDLAERLLTPSPSTRLSVKEALQASWFSTSRIASKRFDSMDFSRAMLPAVPLVEGMPQA